MAAQTTALGHFAVARTWRWLVVWFALCSAVWVLPLIFHGSYATAISRDLFGPLLPLGMLAGVIGLYWGLITALALVSSEAVALRLEDGRAIYVARSLISFKIDQVRSVEYIDKSGDPTILVHLVNGRKKSLPTTLLAEPADQIVDRIRTAAGLSGTPQRPVPAARSARLL